MACTDEETGKLIGRYELGLLTEEERVRFEAHLAVCDACFQDLYRMAPVADLVREEKLAPTASIELSDEAAPERSLETRRPPVPFPGARRRWAFAAAGAVAACLVAVVAFHFFSLWERPERLRGQEGLPILVTAPIGEVPVPDRLEWEPIPQARSYQVALRTEAGKLLFEGTVTAPPALLPPSVQKSLQPGKTYAWQVEALSEGVRYRSQETPFTVRR